MANQPQPSSNTNQSSTQNATSTGPSARSQTIIAQDSSQEILAYSKSLLELANNLVQAGGNASTLQGAISKLQTALSNGANSLVEVNGRASELQQALVSLSSAASSGSSGMRKFEEGILDVAASALAQSKSTYSAARAVDSYVKEQMRALAGNKGSFKSMLELSVAHERFKRSSELSSSATAKMRTAMQMAEFSAKSLGEKISATSSGMAKASSSALSFGRGIAGMISQISGVSISLSNARKMNLEYNASVISIIRSSRITGESIKGLGGILENVAKTTSMSRVEFVKFAADFQRSFMGMGIATNQLAQFAQGLKQSFGDDIASQTAAATALKQVMSSFPDLGRQIMEANIMAGQAAQESNEQIKAQLMSELEAKKAMIQLTAEYAGISGESLSYVVGMTQTLNAEQERLNVSLEAQNNLKKTSEELLLEVAHKLEGLINSGSKFATTMIEGLQAVIGPVLAVGGALTVLTGVIKILTFAKMAWTKITQGTNFVLGLTTKGVSKLGVAFWTALGPIGLLVYGVYYACKKLYDMVKKINAPAEDLAESVDDLGSSSGRARANLADLARSSLAASEATNRQSQSLDNVAARLQTARQNAENYRKINLDLVSAIDSVVKSLSSMMGLNSDNVGFLFNEMKSGIEGSRVAAEELLASMMDGARLDTLIRLGVKIDKDSIDVRDVDASFRDISAAMSSRASELEIQIEGAKIELFDAKGQDNIDAATEKLNRLRGELTAIRTSQQDMTKAMGQSLEAQANLIELQIRQASALTGQQLKFNSVIARRLQLEGEIVSAAQFGMGASISIMQQRINLANQSLQIAQKEVDNHQALMDSLYLESAQRGEISSSQAESLRELTKRVSSEEELVEIIKSMNLDRSVEERLLRESQSLYMAREEASIRMLANQKEIYELTKEVREGYLDAMREMASGNSAFGSIVATSTSGVTKLISAVERTEGQGAANTMRYGGMQTREQTNRGLGQIQIRYTTEGLVGNIDKDNERYANNELSRRQRDAMEQSRAVEANPAGGSALAISEAQGDALRQFAGSSEELTEAIHRSAQATENLADTMDRAIPSSVNNLPQTDAVGRMMSIDESLRISGSTNSGNFNVPQRVSLQTLRRGGVVGGTGSGDRVPALLEPGEYVINKRASSQYGEFLEDINNDRVTGYSTGGPVGRSGTQSRIRRERAEAREASEPRAAQRPASRAQNAQPDTVQVLSISAYDEGMVPQRENVTEELKKLNDALRSFEIKDEDYGAEMYELLSRYALEQNDISGLSGIMTKAGVGGAFDEVISRIREDAGEDRFMGQLAGERQRQVNVFRASEFSDVVSREIANANWTGEGRMPDQLASAISQLLEERGVASREIAGSKTMADFLRDEMRPDGGLGNTMMLPSLLEQHQQKLAEELQNNAMATRLAREAAERNSEALQQSADAVIAATQAEQDRIRKEEAQGRIGIAQDSISSTMARSMGVDGALMGGSRELINSILSKSGIDVGTMEDPSKVSEALSSMYSRAQEIISGGESIERGNYTPEFARGAESRISELTGLIAKADDSGEDVESARLRSEMSSIVKNYGRYFQMDEGQGRALDVAYAANSVRREVSSRAQEQAAPQIALQRQRERLIGMGISGTNLENAMSRIGSGESEEIVRNQMLASQGGAAGSSASRSSASSLPRRGSGRMTPRMVQFGGGSRISAGTGWQNKANADFANSRRMRNEGVGSLSSLGAARGNASASISSANPDFSNIYGGRDKTEVLTTVKIDLSPAAQNLLRANQNTRQNNIASSGGTGNTPPSPAEQR